METNRRSAPRPRLFEGARAPCDALERSAPADAAPRSVARARGLSWLLALGLAAPTLAACEPAEQAEAERQARVVAQRVSSRASEEGRRILRKAERELGKLRGKVRRGTQRLREHSDDAKEVLQQLRPPPGEAPPPVADDAIRCEGDTCTIAAETLARFAKDPAQLLHEGTVIPAMSGAEVRGLQVLSLRSGGVGERLGLRPGDVLLAVDDAPITAVMRDAETQRRLASKRRWTLTLRRDGSAVTRTIALR